MATKMCGRQGCKSRHKKALWMIDRVPYCGHCYEQFLQTHFCDEHTIVRLSDNEYDFPDRDYIQARRNQPYLV